MGVFLRKTDTEENRCFGKHATILAKTSSLSLFLWPFASAHNRVIASLVFHFHSQQFQFTQINLIYLIFSRVCFSFSIRKFAYFAPCSSSSSVRACVCECVLCSVCMSEWCMGFETRTSKQSFAFDGSEQTDDNYDDALSASNFSTPDCTENNFH